MLDFEAILGHCGPLFGPFWVQNGLGNPQRTKIGQKGRPPRGRVFDISAVHGKVGQIGRQMGVKMLKKKHFLVLAQNALKCHPTGLKRCTARHNGRLRRPWSLRRRDFGAAPVVVAAYGGQITHPK